MWSCDCIFGCSLTAHMAGLRHGLGTRCTKAELLPRFHSPVCCPIPLAQSMESNRLTGSKTQDRTCTRPDLMWPNKQAGRLFSSHRAVAVVSRTNPEHRRGSPAADPHLALLCLDKVIQGLVLNECSVQSVDFRVYG
jgi:hypothetical protein